MRVTLQRANQDGCRRVFVPERRSGRPMVRCAPWFGQPKPQLQETDPAARRERSGGARPGASRRNRSKHPGRAVVRTRAAGSV